MFCGIDTHKRTLAACIVDQVGRQRSGRSFANTPEGHAQLAAWVRELRTERIGIEGSGSYGFVLAQTLLAAGERVVDVPANRTARARKALSKRGKDDPADALAIARVTAGDEPLVELKTCPVAGDLQLLDEHRQQLVRERVRLLNRVHSDFVILRPGERIELKSSPAALRRCIDLLTPASNVQATLARQRLERLLVLITEIDEVNKRTSALLDHSGTTLTTLRGIGPTLAATIIGQTGNIDRYKTCDQFAAANGTAPIPASSGQTQRHRLNRFGNRRLNYAIHQMAIVQLRYDPRAQAYIDKHIKLGKSRKEAIRCLKRRLSDVVWRQMRQDHLTTT